jgi:hemolysin III
LTPSHLKQPHSLAEDDPIHWNYDRTEVAADALVHAIGVGLGMIGAITLLRISAASKTAVPLAIAIYAVGLMTMLVSSAMYNLWPVSPRKWLLRRLDQSAIYLFIAATYTPFISQFNDSEFAIKLLIGLWSIAIVGAVLNLNWPGRFDKLSIALYLAMGWSGTLVYGTVGSSLPSSILLLIATGGILYTLGILFHLWERLRFQNAIWHAFVALGAGCHFLAVAGLMRA